MRVVPEPSPEPPWDASAFLGFERAGWNRVAHLYDRVWAPITRQLAPALLRAARVGPGRRLLDLACGPGYVMALARTEGAAVAGVDLSPAMVAEARRRHPDLEAREGAAEEIPFADASFDAVITNFGFPHFADPERALTEARRVLRRGGRLAFTAWAAPEVCPGSRIVDAAVRAHAELDVGLVAGPPRHGPADPEDYRGGLRRAGFVPGSLRFENHTAWWRVPTTAAVFEAEYGAGVRTAALLQRQPPQRLAAIRAAIENGVEAYAAAEGGYALPMVAHLVAAEAG